MKQFRWVAVLLLIMIGKVQAQKAFYNAQKQGQFFLFWGWNRAAYSNSTISLKGTDYDFVIKKVVARDRPTLPITYDDYLKPGKITIPQTNFRMGYFIKDNFAIALGVDHMKYVMKQDQMVQMEGYIQRSGKYQGVYNGPQQMTEDLLNFEHTDGLNYINFSVEKYKLLYQSKSNQCIVSAMIGGGAGVLFPKTNAKLLDYERSDRFHLAGFGLNMKAGLQAVFFKHLMVRFETSGGYINMPDILLHQTGIEGKAKQHFFFAEADASIGFTCNLKGKTSKKKTNQ